MPQTWSNVRKSINWNYNSKLICWSWVILDGSIPCVSCFFTRMYMLNWWQFVLESGPSFDLTSCKAAITRAYILQWIITANYWYSRSQAIQATLMQYSPDFRNRNISIYGGPWSCDLYHDHIHASGRVHISHGPSEERNDRRNCQLLLGTILLALY